MTKQETVSTGTVTAEIQRKQPNSKIGILREWAFRFQPGENALTAALRSTLRVIFIIIHEFNETRISLRASALTYSIVLSLVPLLAMSTAILKGLGGGDQLKVAAYQFIDQFEADTPSAPRIPRPPGTEQLPASSQASSASASVPSSPAESDATPSAAVPGASEAPGRATAPPEAGQSITTHLRDAVDTIFNYVERTNFAALGAFGIAGLLIAVVLVMSTIEEAMNAIWHSRRGRSLFRKVMDYLALLILLPISINVALAGDAVIASPTILARLHAFIPFEWMVTMILKFLPFLFVILTLMVMYMFFPTVRVRTRAAFAGALFAGVFWFLIQKAYIVLQLGVSKYNAIYGSFATVPLFLIWVQMGWTFILLGASLAYAVQHRNLYSLPGATTTPQRDLQLAFDVLNTVYENFRNRKPTTFEELVTANPTDQPGNIQEIVDRLIPGGLLHLAGENGRTYVPAAPAEAIEAREVVELILGRETIPTVGGKFSREAVTAAAEAIPAEAFPAVPADKPAVPADKAAVSADRPEKNPAPGSPPAIPEEQPPAPVPPESGQTPSHTAKKGNDTHAEAS